MTYPSRDIICMALPAWEGDYMKTIVQVCDQLARRHRVLYVEYPFTWKDYALARLGRKTAPLERLRDRSRALRQVTTSEGHPLHVLTLPPVWPTRWINAPGWFDRLQGREAERAGRAVRRAAEQLGMCAPLVINAFNPTFGLPLLDRLGASKTLYYCYDEISTAAWLGKHGARYEAAFLPQTDGLVATSATLWQRKSVLQPKGGLVRNGVDYPLFHQGFRLEPPGLGRPRVAYLGSVDDRLDVGLIKAVAGAVPEADFVFTGRIVHNEVARALSRVPNIRLEGPRPPEALPGILAESAAGIIPFRRNRFTENIYPLKINEYLAAGLPVVMTGFAKLPEFEPVASVAESAPGFAACLRSEIAGDSSRRRLARAAFAHGNSWEARAEALERIIDGLYA